MIPTLITRHHGRTTISPLETATPFCRWGDHKFSHGIRCVRTYIVLKKGVYCFNCISLVLVKFLIEHGTISKKIERGNSLLITPQKQRLI